MPSPRAIAIVQREMPEAIIVTDPPEVVRHAGRRTVIVQRGAIGGEIRQRTGRTVFVHIQGPVVNGQPTRRALLVDEDDGTIVGAQG